MAKIKKKTPFEKLRNDFKTKQIFYYVDPENEIDIKVREVYKNGKKEVHYPFSKKDGRPKYGELVKIIYEDMPKNLPRGFLKSFTTGYGFTKIYNPIVYATQDKYPDVKSITITNSQKTEFKQDELILDWQELDDHYDKIDVMFKRHGNEKKKLAENVLSDIFPKKFKISKSKYIKNSAGAYLDEATKNIKDFSSKDVQSVVDLFTLVAEEKEGIDTRKVLKTKEILEEYYLDEILGEFKKKLNQTTDTSTLEKKWQVFFKNYSWIFSQLFASPVLYFQSEAYVGGKSYDNKNGKLVDFIYKNELTNNMALIEIKTHLTPLLEKRPYRGKDVFSITKDLGGAIAQILDQKDNLMKSFDSVFKDDDSQAYNPKCIVVVGKVSPLKKGQKKSFELFRSNCKEVHIITFDEVCRKIDNLLQIISKKKTVKKKVAKKKR